METYTWSRSPNFDTAEATAVANVEALTVFVDRNVERLPAEGWEDVEYLRWSANMDVESGDEVSYEAGIVIILPEEAYADQLPSFPSHRPEFSTTSGAARRVLLLMLQNSSKASRNHYLKSAGVVLIDMPLRGA
jgi:hypothetical protein